MIERQGPAPLAIVSTMALTFIASLAFMLRHQRAVRPAVPPAPPRALEVEVNAPLHPDTGAAADSRDSGPVLIVVRKNRRSAAVEATARNDSGQSVSLTLAAEDGRGEVLSIERLDLGAGEAHRFGEIHGVPLPNGGKIRIQTPGYIDREVDIPL